MKNFLALFVMGLFLFAGCTVDPPLTPTGLSVSSETVNSLTIMWDLSDDATDYILYKSLISGADYSQIYKGSDTNFVDTDLDYATTYYYKVEAENEGGVSSQSGAVSGMTVIPTGFMLTGSPNGVFDYPFHYLNYVGGKPNYQSDPIGLNIVCFTTGDYANLWVIYDQIESMAVYYNLKASDYPPPSGWLFFLDDSATDILLTPIMGEIP